MIQTRLMGVINITPDSFSDGNKYNQKESFAQKFQELLSWADIIDIGAESTAPMNKAVSLEAELNRYEQIFFPLLAKLSDPATTLSIDTYKLEVFEPVFVEIKRRWPNSRVIFNDVSGVIDQHLIKLLRKYPDLIYILAHNQVPARESVQAHMSYLFKGDLSEFLENFIQFFVAGCSKLQEVGAHFYIDPCFGFAKSREQNHYLLKKMRTFLLNIPYEIPCLFGISRKSFLRFPADLDIKQAAGATSVEQIHSNLIMHLIQTQMKREFIIRTHDPMPIQSAHATLSILN